jgi:hypothetical protein
MHIRRKRSDFSQVDPDRDGRDLSGWVVECFYEIFAAQRTYRDHMIDEAEQERIEIIFRSRGDEIADLIGIPENYPRFPTEKDLRKHDKLESIPGVCLDHIGFKTADDNGELFPTFPIPKPAGLRPIQPDPFTAEWKVRVARKNTYNGTGIG